MIGHLRGSLVDRGSNGVLLVDVHGVGYEVNCSVGAFASAGSGDEVHVHTHLVVREDAQTLYGFSSRAERDTFRILIATHGVGPALGLALLATLDQAALASAVANDDTAVLTSVPGIGPKTAQRLIVELRSRLDIVVETPTGSGGAGVRGALEQLGYSSEEIRSVLPKLPSGADASESLRIALAELGGRHA
ncbi:MAG: Holliday junction branch migration protein RuvA [Ilumatobacteraceae bacterium]